MCRGIQHPPQGTTSPLLRRSEAHVTPTVPVYIQKHSYVLQPLLKKLKILPNHHQLTYSKKLFCFHLHSLHEKLIEKRTINRYLFAGLGKLMKKVLNLLVLRLMVGLMLKRVGESRFQVWKWSELSKDDKYLT